MAEHPHRICNRCATLNHYAVRRGIGWKRGVCAICMQERAYTVSISDVADTRDGMAVIVYAVAGAAFGILAVLYSLFCKRYGFLG